MRSNRRDALKAIGVMMALATLGGLDALASAPRAIAKAAKRESTQARGYLDGIQGNSFAACTVAKVGEIENGAVSFALLDPDGQPFTVDLLRHDPKLPGVAKAGSLAVYMKVGHGRRETIEAHGLAAMALAANLARREAAGIPVPALLTLNERVAVRTEWNRRGAPAASA